MYRYLHWQCDMEDSVWSLGRSTHFLYIDTQNAIPEKSGTQWLKGVKTLNVLKTQFAKLRLVYIIQKFCFSASTLQYTCMYGRATGEETTTLINHTATPDCMSMLQLQSWQAGACACKSESVSLLASLSKIMMDTTRHTAY